MSSTACLVVVVGTSLQVYPVNQLPSIANGRIAIINAEPTDMDAAFDLVIHGKAGETLQKLDTWQLQFRSGGSFSMCGKTDLPIG